MGLSLHQASGIHDIGRATIKHKVVSFSPRSISDNDRKPGIVDYESYALMQQIKCAPNRVSRRGAQSAGMTKCDLGGGGCGGWGRAMRIRMLSDRLVGKARVLGW